MTPGRQQRKARLVLGVLLGLVACGGIGGPPARAANDPIVVNHDTGLAISGFDPMAYFTDHKPVCSAGPIWNCALRARVVTGKRLYLFYCAAARATFLTDPSRIVVRATRKWPEVARTIAP